MGRLGDPSLPFIFDGRCGADYAFGAPFVPNGRVGSPQRTQTSGADAPSARLKGSVPHIDILWFPPFRPFACQGTFPGKEEWFGTNECQQTGGDQKRFWLCDSLCRTGGIRAQRAFSGNGCDERRGISQSVGMMVGSLLGKELQSPPIVLP